MAYTIRLHQLVGNRHSIIISIIRAYLKGRGCVVIRYLKSYISYRYTILYLNLRFGLR